MFKINALDKIRWAKKATPAIKRIVSSKKEQEKLLNILRENGYSELADIGDEFTLKYGHEAKKMFS